jgi:tetratricopeptide (TPR) repeat protein
VKTVEAGYARSGGLPCELTVAGPYEEERMTPKTTVLSFVACALVLFTSPAIASDGNPADQLYSRGVELQTSGQLEQAMDSYLAALRENPRHYKALFARAGLYFTKADYQKAARSFEDLLLFYPKDIRARLYLGEALLHLGSAQRAKDIFRKIVVDDPRNITALVGLGRAEYKTGNRFAAVETLKKASALDPRNESIKDSIAAFQSANREYLKRSEEARGQRLKSALNNSIAESTAKVRSELLKARRSRAKDEEAAMLRRQMVLGATGEAEAEGLDEGRRGSRASRGQSGKLRYDERPQRYPYPK